METNNATKDGTKVVLLGTGTPNAEPDRSGPSVAIMAGGTPYIVDCGPGVVRRVSRAVSKGIAGLEIHKLNRLFITHLHSDHAAGYPDLILTPWVLMRDEPLKVYGPPGLESMTKDILSAYREDIRERLEGMQPSNKDGIRVEVSEIRSGEIYHDENVTVNAFRMRHGSLESYGYKFITSDRTVTVSGDTAPFDELADFYRGSDVLIHEVYSTKGFGRYPPEWQRYHSAMHTSSTELAAIASKAEPGLLVCYHQLFNGVNEDELTGEIHEGYSGKVVSGKDLDVY